MHDGAYPERDDGREDEAGAVGASVLVVASGDGGPGLETAEGALDDIASAVRTGKSSGLPPAWSGVRRIASGRPTRASL